MARSAPFWFTTIPMISTSSGGSSSFKTASESAICGMALGETNDTASICLNHAPISARRYCTFTAEGIWPLRPCQASRGHSINLLSFDMGHRECFIHHGGTETLRNTGHKTFRTIRARNTGTFEVDDKSDWLAKELHVSE